MRDTEYYLIFVEYVIFGDVYLLTGKFMKKNKQRSDRARSEVFRCIGRKCVCVCVLLNPVHCSLLKLTRALAWRGDGEGCSVARARARARRRLEYR